ncbi:lipid II:glycine glycyltransferase FemX [Dictyobacter vulcani]|uniref:lipid II:glycine glycyltransferase FemX n=1 Tax=Dictyobacter vulcani TaxID=2607529 RepID=UPI0012505B4F|nr:peptidoglycan bridge formation glycyltransferase FemA/FemB family protein [Dictyobacter vulcani]
MLGLGELKATSGWSPLRLALYVDGEIVAAAQVLRKTAPRVPLALGHLAYIPRGPVVDWLQPGLCEEFFRQLDRYLRRRGAIALRWEPDIDQATPEGELVARFARSRGAGILPTVQPQRTIVLDLEPDEERLLAQMKEKWRYNIRLGGRKGVQIRVANSLADVDAWYALLETTGERDQFGIHSLAYYQQAWKVFAPDDRLRLLLAEHDGQLLAGIVVVMLAGQAIYLYGASSNQQRQLMPNYVLQWEAIRWAKQQGARQYDFWGIPATDAEDEAMAGVYRFKRGWGGRVLHYAGGYEHVYHPLLMKVARRFF